MEWAFCQFQIENLELRSVQMHSSWGGRYQSMILMKKMVYAILAPARPSFRT